MSDDYEVIPPEAIAASKVLVDFKVRLGNPEDPYSESGKKLMELIISVWQDLYPLQWKMWNEERDEYKVAEKSTGEQVHQKTGRSLVSIPYPVYQLMQKLFPNFKMSDREEYIKFANEYKIFQMANKI